MDGSHACWVFYLCSHNKFLHCRHFVVGDKTGGILFVCCAWCLCARQTHRPFLHITQTCVLVPFTQARQPHPLMLSLLLLISSSSSMGRLSHPSPIPACLPCGLSGSFLSFPSPAFFPSLPLSHTFSFFSLMCLVAADLVPAHHTLCGIPSVVALLHISTSPSFCVFSHSHSLPINGWHFGGG